MKKMFDRMLSVVLVFAMCASLMNITAFAADAGDKCPLCETGNIVVDKNDPTHLICDNCAEFSGKVQKPDEPAPEKHECKYDPDTDKCECGELNPAHKHEYDSTGKCRCGDQHTAHEVNNWRLDYSTQTEHVGTCSVCGERVTEPHTLGNPVGGVRHCDKCEYYTYDTPACQHDWKYFSDGKGVEHTRYCPECGATEKENCKLRDNGDGSKECELCNWNNKDIVNADYCLKCGAADHKQDACPNWCSICNQPYILASCGGKYCANANGQAIHIIKGSSCRDSMNGFDTANVHDHQCDFCHAHHLDLTTEDTTATCTSPGHTTIKCGYPGCDYVESEMDVSALGHTFVKADVSDNCESHSDAECTGHTLTCSRCGGEEGKDANGNEAKVIEPHKYDKGVEAKVDGKEGTKYTCTVCGHWYFKANSEAKKYTLTINYRYDDNYGIFATYKGEFAAGEEYKVESRPAPEGYDFAAKNLDEVKTGTMPDHNLELIVSYKPITYTQTIVYVIDGETDPFDTKVISFTVNDLKGLQGTPSPAKEGYTADQTVVPAPEKLDNTTVKVTYKLNRHTLTIRYLYEDGTQVEPDNVQENVPFGALIPDPVKPLDGYGASVSGMPTDERMPDGDLVITVTYTRDRYNVTVNVYVDGERVSNETTQTQVGAAIPRPSTSREGASFLRMSGYVDTMPSRDVTINVYFETEQSEPPAEVNDPEVPQVNEPEVEVNEPDVPLAEEPEVEIQEPEVPLVKEPEIEIEDPDVPMAEVPQTGDRTWMWSLTAAVSALGLALLAFCRKQEDQEG